MNEENIKNYECDLITCKICNLTTKVPTDWHNSMFMDTEFVFHKILLFLHKIKNFYPPIHQIFTFANYFSLKNTKVVILGQDPYHGVNQATGLSFSVNNGVKKPPSLRNIFVELKNNYPNFVIPQHGNLENWAKQGVLLLNDTLTVTENKPASHSKIGWQKITSNVISSVSKECNSVVFILWGANAHSKKYLIDERKHLVLCSSHPSPFSARKGFFGSNHFLKANAFLLKNNVEIIDWCDL